MEKKSLVKSLSGLAGLAVLFAILVTINILAGSYRARADLTREKLFTLSDGTRKLMSELTAPVTLKFYYSKNSDAALVPLEQYADRVLDLLREYTSLSKSKVTVEVYDPQPDSDEEEWAQRYGVAGQPIGFIGGPNLYFGLVAVSGNREAVLSTISPQAEPQLEYLVTRMIHEVTHTGKTKLAILSSLPVMGAPAMPFGPPQPTAQPWVIISELKKQYEVTSLEPGVKEIPGDINILMVIHPKELTEDTLFAIDQFVLRGGRLLAFVDPLCLTEQQTMPQMGGGMFANSSELNRLTKPWGVEMMPSEVVSDPDAASQVSYDSGGMDISPTWLSLRGRNLDRNEIATSSLDSLMLPFAGSLKGTTPEGIERSDLIHSSADAGLVQSFQALSPRSTVNRDAEHPGTQILATRLKGRFHTAFPEGPPQPPRDPTQTNAPPPQVRTDWLKESAQDGVVVLVSDVDMLFDRFCVRGINFFGQTFYEPRNENLVLAQNLVEQLAGSEALIGLRSRGTYQRPFDKVIALERTARERWEQKEAELQQKLQETQARINELQASKEKDQKFIVSPEQRKEIESFRKQRFETQRQLKEVRKNLRHDIEALGLKLKVMNMALVPIGVALFGIARGWRRRHRASS